MKTVKFTNLLGVPVVSLNPAVGNDASGDRADAVATVAPVPATPGLLRSINNRTVLDLLIQHHTLSRGDVCRMTGVSKPTASQLLTRLLDARLVLDAGLGSPRPGGRAPQMYRLNPRAGFAAAINVDPTGIQVRVADLVGTTIAEATFPTDADDAVHGPDQAVQALEATAAQAGISLDDLAATVIGVPGSYDPSTDQLRFSDHLHDWQQTGLVAHLGSSIPGSVAIENDVNLVAVVEQHEREGAAENFVLLWLDERIGAAIVVDGKLFRGSRGAAGEAAFLQVPGVQTASNPAHSHHGGFEDLAADDAIVKLAARAGISSTNGADAMAALVATPTQAARDLVTEIAGRYAIALASIVALIDPAQVILAGSLVDAGGPMLIDAVTRELGAVAIATPPVSAGLVTDSPITRGAMILSLRLARDRVFNT